jgi:hypothetical protein
MHTHASLPRPIRSWIKKIDQIERVCTYARVPCTREQVPHGV